MAFRSPVSIKYIFGCLLISLFLFAKKRSASSQKYILLIPGRVRLFSTMLLGILLLVAIFKGIDIFMGQRLIGYQMFLASFFSAICVVLLAAIIRNRLSVLLSIYLLFLPTFIFLIIMDIILRVSKLY